MLCSPPCWRVRRLQRWALERVGRGKLLLRCRLLGGARRFGAHEGGEGRSISWWPPAYSLLRTHTGTKPADTASTLFSRFRLSAHARVQEDNRRDGRPPTSAKTVHFSLLACILYLRQRGYGFISVCLLSGLCKTYSTIIFTKIGRKVAQGRRKKPLDSGSNPDHVTVRLWLGRIRITVR